MNGPISEEHVVIDRVFTLRAYQDSWSFCQPLYVRVMLGGKLRHAETLRYKYTSPPHANCAFMFMLRADTRISFIG